MKSLIVIICNPAARRASMRSVGEAAFLLRKKGFETKVYMTGRRGDAEALARGQASERPHAVLAAGGDGTINEVINGMFRSDVPVAVLPLGTTNVLAKELGIPEDVEGSISRMTGAGPRLVSLGRIERCGEPGSARYFCLMAGVGFDGKAVHDMNPRIKKFSGKAAYILSGIKNAVEYSPEGLTFLIDGKEYLGYGGIIGKASRYGGNFRAAPDADLADPSFYAFIYQGNRRSDLVRYVKGVVRGNHLKEKDIVYLKAEEIEIRGSAHIQIDGDYYGLAPARLTVEKDALKIIY